MKYPIQLIPTAATDRLIWNPVSKHKKAATVMPRSLYSVITALVAVIQP